MPSNRVVRLRRDQDVALARSLRQGIERIQTEQDLHPEFPSEVLEAAERGRQRRGCRDSTGPISSC